MSTWDRLEPWLAEDPEINWAEVEIGRSRRWCVRLMQACAQDEETPTGRRCLVEAESETLEGAVEGVLVLVAEYKEGYV